MSDGPPAHVERYVLVVAGAAALAFGVLLATLAQSSLPALAAPGVLLVAAALVAAYVCFQFFAFEFEWRGHWLTANLDEVVLFLGLVFLPGPLGVVLIPLAEACVHAATGRPRVKGVFNVGQLVLASAAAWDAFALLRAFGVPSLVAATVAVPTYVATSNLLLAGVFARLEGERTLRVYAQRFAPTTLVLTTLGVGGGVAVYALSRLHPTAVLALTPFVFAMHRNTALTSRADRELRVHRALAEGSTRLVDTWSLDSVAEYVLDITGATLPAGRATLRVGPRAWTRDYEGGPAPEARETVVELRGRDGSPLGTLAVAARPGQRAFGEGEGTLLRIVAAQAASAVLKEEAHRAALARQDALAKQEKLSALGMLIANVAHEIGNPLSYMRLSLQTLKVQAEKLAAHEDPGVRLAAERFLAGVATAQKGVNNVVDISTSLRAVARQGPGGHKPVDLNVVARDVANVVRIGFAKDVALRVEVDAEAVLAHGNAGELTQVVLNLAKNAAEAMDGRGGSVTLRTERREDRVRLLVADDGPGIPPEVMDKLFQPFFTTKETGTGIGLNISRGIARAHGGDLTCRTVPGEGTTFVLDLPALAADPSRGPETQHPYALPSGDPPAVAPWHAAP